MADGYEKCTQAQGRIPFGLQHIKLLIGVMHWVQDQDHCHRNASTGDIADANEFREIIDISILTEFGSLQAHTQWRRM